MPNVRLRARIVGVVAALEVHVKVHVAPKVVLFALVVIKVRASEVGHVVIGFPGKATRKACVLQDVIPFVVLFTQRAKTVDHQASNDVKEQHADPNEKTQVESNTLQVVWLVTVGDSVQDFAHTPLRNTHVENEEEAAHDRVAANCFLVVSHAVVVKVVFKVLEPKL